MVRVRVRVRVRVAARATVAFSIVAEFTVLTGKKWTPERNVIGNTHGRASSGGAKAWETQWHPRVQ
jgi:hypothetical protein